MRVQIPYHREFVSVDLPDDRVVGILQASLPPEGGPSPEVLVEQALQHPIASPPLSELARKASRVLIISSDHTRPVPSAIIMPLLLQEIRRGNESAEITILVATGCHRASTREELTARYGEEIVSREHIQMHDSHDSLGMVYKGKMPSGADLYLNSLVDWADLIVAEGFIEPHFFAGFSGGRKSIMPGIASATTVLRNHCAAFISHPKARTGVLEGNPIHEDMAYAANLVGLDFIVNVALDKDKRVIGAWAGHHEQAHQAGCSFVRQMAAVQALPCDIAITSNGGYPLDQNIYQAVKCMTAAEQCVRPGGVIIVSAGCIDGHGGEHFFQQSSQDASSQAILEQIAQIPASKTEADQWQTQILMRVLAHANVIMVSTPEVRPYVEKMHMTYAPSLEEAIVLADAMTGGGQYVVIPDGVAVIVEK